LRTLSAGILSLALAGVLVCRVQAQAAAMAGGPGISVDDDGSHLWLYYRTVRDPDRLEAYRSQISQIIVNGGSAVAGSTRAELVEALSSLLNRKIPAADAVTQDGAIVAGTPENSAAIQGLGWESPLRALNPDGFIIRSTVIGGHHAIAIAGNTESGALYGAFSFLRMIQCGSSIANLDLTDQPLIKWRQYQDWTNWDGGDEHGYGGKGILTSLTTETPGRLSPRVKFEARAMAAIGLNSITINNVNFDPAWLRSQNLPKIKRIADVYRDYGIRIFLAAGFDSPVLVGGLPTYDPLDPAVIAWWNRKADEIYEAIPDFGGFLLKADSERQPGPAHYHRSPVEGAACVANAVARHGGYILWRGFVYNRAIDPDRAKDSYLWFRPYDGQFPKNLILQCKNGPWDFQDREPNHPLIGAMPKTDTGIELQITQEYMGQGKDLCWLVPQWKYYLSFDTAASLARPSTVKDVLTGTTFGYHETLFAGVSCMGLDTNWTGQTLAQANQYGFGRLAWNPNLSADTIADEWAAVTYGYDPAVLNTVKSILLGSWETYEKYCLVGSCAEIRTHLSHLNHYDPDLKQNNDHLRADALGVGFDRTRSGTDAVDQYAPTIAEKFNNLATCPPEYLFWFHHVPYTYEVFPGKTVIQWIYDTHFEGKANVEKTVAEWKTLQGKMSDARFNEVLAALTAQVAEADHWAHTVNRFFYNLSKIPDDQGRDVSTP
jgi:alpha-glucuronidase